MKKLMTFAAWMAISGGAFAACTLPTDLYCAQVYDFKASIKTTVGKIKVDCEEICYRAKGSTKLTGYLYSCDCSCAGFMTASLYLYDKNTDQEYFGYPHWLFLNRIGKKNTDAEGIFVVPLSTSSSEVTLLDVGDVFYAAGTGKFDDDGALKNMSGYLVGIRMPPYCSDDCSVGSYAVAYPWCTLDNEQEIPGAQQIPYYDNPTVGFGSWSIKYNKKLSGKYADGLWQPPYVPPVPNGTQY